MPVLLPRCARCGARLLESAADDGPVFCSDECRALHDDPDLLAHLAAEGPSPGRVRLYASLWLVVSLAVSGVLLSMPWLKPIAPAFLTGVIFLPVIFLAELVTGRSAWQMNLWYHSLTLPRRFGLALGLLSGAIAAVVLGAWVVGGFGPR